MVRDSKYGVTSAHGVLRKGHLGEKYVLVSRFVISTWFWGGKSQTQPKQTNRTKTTNPTKSTNQPHLPPNQLTNQPTDQPANLGEQIEVHWGHRGAGSCAMALRVEL